MLGTQTPNSTPVPLPDTLKEWLVNGENDSSTDGQATEGDIREGHRNTTLLSLAGSMRAAGMEVEEILPALLAINTNRCTTSLDDKEVEEIAQSIGRYPPGASRGRNTQGKILVETALKRGLELFKDPEGNAWGTFPVGSHGENHTLRSNHFRLWLMRLFYKAVGKPAASQGLQAAISQLESMALFDDGIVCHKVFVRTAEHNGRIYLDLADQSWDAVEIDGTGWRLVSDVPVKFRRPRGMLPLPQPVKGYQIHKARQFFNISDDASWVLLLSWLVQALRPAGPFPVLVVTGEQGSAKSTLVRLVRMPVDPFTAPLRALPRSERDLMITARNSLVLAFDNVSHLQDWRSDAFCRLATGGGMATRRLYSDAEEEFFDSQRPIILNGISTVATRSDLLDRSIILELPQIPKHRRREESEILANFERELPGILGALLDAVSTGLSRISSLRVKSLPRMADFAKWAVACEPAFQLKGTSFLDVYDANRAQAAADTLANNALAAALVEFVRVRGKWSGGSAQLLGELEGIVDEKTRKLKEWPGSASWLSKRLRELAPVLRTAGIEIGLGKKRQILITKKNK